MNKKNNRQGIAILDFEGVKKTSGRNNNYGVYIEEHFFADYNVHGHNFYEMELSLSENVQMFANGKNYRVSYGDIVFIKPGDVHGMKTIGEKRGRTITVCWENSVFRKKFDLFNIKEKVIKANDEIIFLFNALNREQSIHDEYTEKMLYNILERILIYILRNTNHSRAENRVDNEIMAALGYIQEYFMEDLTLEKISRICGFSVSHFSKMMKETTGKTFIEYLNDIRLKFAANLIKTGNNVLITEVAFDCGFGSVRNFNREFKKKYGYSPNEFKHKQNEFK